MTVTHGGCHEYVGMDFKHLRREKAMEYFMKNRLEEAIEDFSGDMSIFLQPYISLKLTIVVLN